MSRMAGLVTVEALFLTLLAGTATAIAPDPATVPARRPRSQLEVAAFQRCPSRSLK
jgi:hypothetical protein